MKLDYHVQIFGTSQTGKTTVALKMLMDQAGISFFVDTKEETIFHKYFHYHANIEHVSMFLENAKEFERKRVRIKIIPELDQVKQLEEISKQIFLHQRENPLYRVNLLIDEIPFYNLTSKNSRWTKALILQGLSKNIRVLATSQKFTEMPTVFRKGCEIFVVLNMVESELTALMDAGILDYTKDERGWRKHNLKFNNNCTHGGKMPHSHDAYIRFGWQDKMRKLK